MTVAEGACDSAVAKTLVGPIASIVTLVRALPVGPTLAAVGALVAEVADAVRLQMKGAYKSAAEALLVVKWLARS